MPDSSSTIDHIDSQTKQPSSAHTATVTAIVAVGDTVLLSSLNDEEHPLTSSKEAHNYKIFKPYGYLSQFVPERRKSKPLLGELAEFPIGIMAIGRLDHDSEGLLLLSTDGMESHLVRSKKVAKEYYVQVDGDIDELAISKLQTGVEIGISSGKYLTLPCKVFKLDAAPKLPSNGRKERDARHGPLSWISITICEGKNRQIRKMTAAAGFPTMRLVRVRIGKILLDNMQPGEVLSIPPATSLI